LTFVIQNWRGILKETAKEEPTWRKFVLGQKCLLKAGYWCFASLKLAFLDSKSDYFKTTNLVLSWSFTHPFPVAYQKYQFSAFL